MKQLLILLLIITHSVSAQTIDYNLKKGYVANGFDVVAYFNNEAIEGDKKFTTSFDGVKYKFSSSENLEVFNKNPEKYIPQYGGYCAYAIALKSDKVSINPQTFQIKDEKLYLFYNAWGTNTLKLWKKENEIVLREKADKNWMNIKFKK
ncbi:hypothetical protein DIS18_03300 [Algibacter marinivivus]|uniref:YHS domain-containing protein n=1 Tax=Algibacter marinivivus TaxID=2100723 RepID=A0A2U2X760_9FLAO|nr:YHS domain-containing (seleno)protein [Algibacter marinivivus]PWH83594.1 hypothetical protein DIS18_03300 [Algibacter marinivivus]